MGLWMSSREILKDFEAETLEHRHSRRPSL